MRWQIELFFKRIKQNLVIKSFVGTTENAVMTQIWTAAIAILLFGNLCEIRICLPNLL
ncbi:transposase [Parasutterella sp. NM82_D38]|uniref:Transposase n=1 Tax=Parasutterella muris TaxID=2565572 RepID=A0A6L6YFH0_9BURK|nr:transposase [Parasutterella muris]